MPVVNLWIPLQIMDDIWQARLPRQSRSWIAWLPALWWTSFILSAALLVLNQGLVVTLPIVASHQPGSAAAGGYGPYLPDSWPSFLSSAVAGLTLIAIIRTVSLGPLGVPTAPTRPEVSAAG